MKQKINYQKELEKVLEGLGTNNKLLLHACCAPCSSYCLEYLSQYFDITVLYYNPNISPREEYETRAAELERLISEMPMQHKAVFLNGNYEPEKFYEAAKGLEKVPEGGARCEKCFRLRLEEAARYAKKGGYDWFTTTLTISPLKNAAMLNDIGMEMAEKYGVNWLPSDFKKKDGYKRSTELSKIYDLYRQNYCGCVFSRTNINTEE